MMGGKKKKKKTKRAVSISGSESSSHRSYFEEQQDFYPLVQPTVWEPMQMGMPTAAHMMPMGSPVMMDPAFPTMGMATPAVTQSMPAMPTQMVGGYEMQGLPGTPVMTTQGMNSYTALPAMDNVGFGMQANPGVW